MGLFGQSPTSSSLRPRRGKWVRRLLVSFGLLVLLVLAAPLLIGWGPVLNELLAFALPQMKGQVHVGGASLWWLSPPVLTDLEVRDRQGRVLAQAARVEMSKTLLSLLSDLSDLGEVRVVEPALSLVCSRGQTNLEEALAPWLEGDDEAKSSVLPMEGTALRVELVQAKVSLQDQDTGKHWLVDPVALSVAVPHDRRTPLRLTLHGETGSAGRLDVEAGMHLVEAAGAGPRLAVEGAVHGQGLPLALAGAVLRRFQPGLKMEGQLRVDLDVHADDLRHDGRAEGKVAVEELVLAAPLLSEDTLRLQHMEAPFRVSRVGRRVTVEQAELRCDVAHASLAGSVDLEQGLTEQLAQAGQRIDVEADLARLTRLLPSTVALPPQTSLRSGGLTLHLRSTARPDGALWEGEARTADLEGVCEGKKLLWKKPITLVFAVRQAPNALPVFESFRCESDFVQMEVSGSVADLSVRASLDLDRLSERARQLLDLGDLRVQGQGSVQLAVHRDPTGGLQMKGDARVDGLALAGLKGRVCREEWVTAHADVSALADAGFQLRQARLHLQAGTDGLDLSLAGPTRGWAQVALHGDLGRWQARLGCLVDSLDGLQLGGQGELTARLHSGDDALDFEDLKLVGRDFRLRGLGLSVQEPALELSCSGQLVWTPMRLEAKQMRLSCPTVSAAWPALTVTFTPAGTPLLQGDATLHGDVARLSRLLLAPPPSTPDCLAGSFAGQVNLRPAVEQQDVQLDLTLQNVVYGSPAAPTWREPTIHLAGQGAYDSVRDLLRIARLQIDSSVIGCQAAGQVAQLSGRMDLTLAGQLSYDLQKLEPQLRPYLGQGVKLTGHDSRPFRISGPLAAAVPQPLGVTLGPAPAPTAPAAPDLLARLTGELVTSWQLVQAYGAEVGPAEVRGRLTGGLLSVAPLDTTLNQGRLHLEPTLRLSPLPQDITVAGGKLIDHARLTPAVCSSALGYALPVLADVAEVQGELSLEADRVRLPLADPNQASAAGRFVIHEARVGPGPLVRELTVLLRGPSTLTLARDNVVPFQVANGRVYHSNLELHFPELTVRTSGSVGLDGSLSLVAEMPVPPKWLPAGDLGQALARQTIRLPIGGTLSRPQLDQQALRDNAQRFLRENVRDNAKDLIRKEMGNELNRLFRKK